MTIFDRVFMTVASAPGTGVIGLGSAVADAINGDYQSFNSAGVTDGAVISYTMVDGHNWECGRGTYGAAETSLARTTIIASSNGGAPINATINAKVFITALAEDLALLAPLESPDFSGNVGLPATSSSAAGVLTIGGTQFLQNYNANVFVGIAGNFTTTGGLNVGVGDLCLAGLTTGSNNMAVGAQALKVLQSGQNNVAVGPYSLLAELIGNSNIALGYNALGAQNGGYFNIGIGSTTGLDITNGSYNTLVGYNTGRGIQGGGYNTILGAQVSGLGASLSNSIILADGAGNIRLDYGKTTASAWTTSGDVTVESVISVNAAISSFNHAFLGGL